MHTQRLKTFQPQPQEPNGGEAIMGQGCGRLLLPEPPGAPLWRLLHKQRRVGGVALRVRSQEKKKGVTGRCGIGLHFPLEQETSSDNHENLFPSFLAPDLGG